MALFLIKRTDSIDYDEYDAIVVRAPNEDEARAFTKTPQFGGSFRFQQFTIEKLAAAGAPRVILESFNAG